MIRNIRKLMAALMCMLMIVSLIPMGVLAEGSTTPETQDISGEEESEDESEEEPEDESEDEPEEESEDETTDPEYSICYSSHVQKIGWQDTVSNGETSGTTGQSLRLEGMTIGIYDTSGEEPVLVEDAVEYSVHVQSIGWQDAVSDGEMAGTSGRSLRLEAITITPGSAISDDYDIYYRVHAQKYGWLGWARNGEISGTSDMSLRLEAIEIRLLPKDSDDAPDQDTRSYYSSTAKGIVTYQTHVQSYGWMTSVADGDISGTQGKSKRVEAYKIWIDNPKDDDGNVIEGSVEYAAYVQGIGWKDTVSEGELAGTTGQSRAVEAIKINLTGELADLYDIYYRVHIRKFGSLGWAMNGETAGSMDYSLRVESIEIMLCEKDDASAPSTEDTRTYLCPDLAGTLSYATAAKGSDAMSSSVGDNEISGSTGTSTALESLVINLDNSAADCYSGTVSYRVHVASEGWLDWVDSGTEAGTIGSGHQIEAIQIKLSDELAKYCDVVYQAHIQSIGWLGWAANGSTAGSTGYSMRVEAVRIRIVAKGSVTASGGELSYTTGFCHPCPGSVVTDYFGGTRNHKGIDFGASTGTPIYSAYYGTVTVVGCNSYNGNYIYIDHGNGYVTKYLHCSAIYVTAGQKVTRGEHIAAVGSTGQSTGPHLHFQIEVNGTAVNPVGYLSL